MLVLSRKTGERILVGENISITIVRIGSNTVRLGFEAPRATNIVREEVTIPQDGPLEADGGPPGPPLLAETIRVSER